MSQAITITFHNQGLRSYIEVDLCNQCPRQDNKGCCGFYAPVFYPTDFAYLLNNKPELVDYILNLTDITVLDASITVNNSIDGDSYKCQFHTSDKGCLLSQNARESVCRHFVCPGIDWETEEKLQAWRSFFNLLSDYEIELNNLIAQKLKEKGLSLRMTGSREAFFAALVPIFAEQTANLPSFFADFPKEETFKIRRTISYGKEWPL